MWHLFNVVNSDNFCMTFSCDDSNISCIKDVLVGVDFWQRLFTSSANIILFFARVTAVSPGSIREREWCLHEVAKLCLTDMCCLIVSEWVLQACLLECHAIRNFTATLSLSRLMPISLPIRYSEMGSTTGIVPVSFGFKYAFVFEYQHFLYLN